MRLSLPFIAVLASMTWPAVAADDAEKVEPPEEIMALEPDSAAGEELYQSVCRNCHGPKAQGMASFPKLNDQDAGYLAARLAQYRAGETVGSNTALMAPHASDLTDQDIADLSHYIATAFDG